MSAYITVQTATDFKLFLQLNHFSEDHVLSASSNLQISEIIHGDKKKYLYLSDLKD
jgi:hypothetical protein